MEDLIIDEYVMCYSLNLQTTIVYHVNYCAALKIKYMTPPKHFFHLSIPPNKSSIKCVAFQSNHLI